mmetsp:Transcript_25923/g.51677  ORF Transcript_25923/g.51677 Transcript_25923/m.51677 type:complete len:146 (+) Transcript_25923:75-512(+)
MASSSSSTISKARVLDYAKMEAGSWLLSSKCKRELEQGIDSHARELSSSCVLQISDALDGKREGGRSAGSGAVDQPLAAMSAGATAAILIGFLLAGALFLAAFKGPKKVSLAAAGQRAKSVSPRKSPGGGGSGRRKGKGRAKGEG